jgi:hypothetical protein
MWEDVLRDTAALIGDADDNVLLGFADCDFDWRWLGWWSWV